MNWAKQHRMTIISVRRGHLGISGFFSGLWWPVERRESPLRSSSRTDSSGLTLGYTRLAYSSSLLTFVSTDINSPCKPCPRVSPPLSPCLHLHDRIRSWKLSTWSATGHAPSSESCVCMDIYKIARLKLIFVSTVAMQFVHAAPFQRAFKCGGRNMGGVKKMSQLISR